MIKNSEVTDFGIFLFGLEVSGMGFPPASYQTPGVQPRVHAIGFQAGVQGADFVRVRVRVAEEDFEGAGVHKDEG